jgi:hypothetical protein
MPYVHSIEKSLTNFMDEFEKLKMENKQLKQIIKELSPKNTHDIYYAKFYDLTHLYIGGFPGFIEENKEAVYMYKIRKHIQENKHKYRDGDIIFVGSTIEDYQQYGFGCITQDCTSCKISEEIFYIMVTPDVYYSKVLVEINEFYRTFFGKDFIDDFEEDYLVKSLKENGNYEHTVLKDTTTLCF